MIIEFQVLGLTCRLLYNIFNPLGCWRWKLDPYKVSAETQESIIDVHIDFLHSKSKADPLRRDSLLQIETSGFFQHQVWRQENGSTLWCYVRKHSDKEYLRFLVNTDWNKISLITDCTETAGDLAFEYLGQIMPIPLLLIHSALTFHGVLMEYKGNGIIISAPSGTGKTTHARLWRNSQNALIINGDRAVIQQEQEKWIGYGQPWSGTSGEQINRKVPIKAIVVLEQSSFNHIKQITGIEAFGTILPHVQYVQWNIEIADLTMTLLDRLIDSIPVFKFGCRPDLESVYVLKEALEKI